MLKKCINIEELKIIIRWTDKAYFNKESYEIDYSNDKMDGWLKIPFISADIVFEKFINSINKEDYKEFFEIVFSVSGYYELSSKYDLYDHLLRENDLLDYFYKFEDDLNEKTLIEWCNENNINYKIKKISKIRYNRIEKKVVGIDHNLEAISFLERKKSIYKNFCIKLSKEKKYEKIVGEIKDYESFEKFIEKYFDDIYDDWDNYLFNSYEDGQFKKKWGES